MNLLLGLYLSALFCSVHTLQCLLCTGDSGQCSTSNSIECPAGSLCSAERTHLSISGYGNSTSVTRFCNTQDICTLLNAPASGIIYSTNTGASSLFNFISCCNFDNCNNINIPEPNNTPNGLKCAACSGQANTTCNSTVFCVGNQDQCVTSIVSNATVKGCISKSLCGVSTYSNATCCSGNMCNGSEAWLRLDLSQLLMVLLAVILLQ